MPAPIMLTRELLATARLGAQLLDDTALRSLRGFISEQQSSTGGFVGPGGQEDIYFTVFGLACADAVAFTIDRGVVRSFLDRTSVREDLDLVHFSCLIQSWALVSAFGPVSLLKRRRIARAFQNFRAEDGGFANEPATQHGTAYGAYMALLGHAAAGVSIPHADRLTDMLRNLQQDDGGFLNERNGTGPTVPATAAAVVTLHALGETIPGSSLTWLRSRCGDGFRMSALAPLPDLLSTGVAMFALSCCGGGLSAEARTGCAAFVEDQWDPDGGFCATVIDEQADVEYTFYGLLALGSLKRLAQNRDG